MSIKATEDIAHGSSVIQDSQQTVVLALPGGQWAKVSEGDYKKISQYAWRVARMGRTHYVYATIHHRRMYLHRLLLPVRPGLTVDHVNGDGLDNRRENLRPATRAQQAMNRRPHRGHWPKGVVRFRGKWRSRVCTGGRSTESSFHSETLAALFYDALAARRFGEFARPNFEQIVSPGRAGELIAGSGGRIFSVVFSRRTDGKERRMTCRTGVAHALKGPGLAFDPHGKGLIGVFDVKKKAYRFIPKDRILCMRIKKTRYAVRPPHDLN